MYNFDFCRFVACFHVQFCFIFDFPDDGDRLWDELRDPAFPAVFGLEGDRDQPGDSG